jgi:hypothetical protein
MDITVVLVSSVARHHPYTPNSQRVGARVHVSKLQLTAAEIDRGRRQLQQRGPAHGVIPHREEKTNVREDNGEIISL